MSLPDPGTGTGLATARTTVPGVCQPLPATQGGAIVVGPLLRLLLSRARAESKPVTAVLHLVVTRGRWRGVRLRV